MELCNTETVVCQLVAVHFVCWSCVCSQSGDGPGDVVLINHDYCPTKYKHLR